LFILGEFFLQLAGDLAFHILVELRSRQPQVLLQEHGVLADDLLEVQPAAVAQLFTEVVIEMCSTSSSAASSSDSAWFLLAGFALTRSSVRQPDDAIPTLPRPARISTSHQIVMLFTHHASFSRRYSSQYTVT